MANEKELWHTFGATEEGVGVDIVGVDEVREVDWEAGLRAAS
jgi:hypothetical protein